MRAVIADQQRVITALAAKATSGEPKPGESKDVATTATVTTHRRARPQRWKIASRKSKTKWWRLGLSA